MAFDLRNDFDSVSLRRLEEDQGRDPEPSSAGVGRHDGGSRTDA